MHLVKRDFAASGSTGVNPLLGLEVTTTPATASATPVTTTATPEAPTSTCDQQSQINIASCTCRLDAS